VNERKILLLVSSVLVVDAALYTALTPLLPSLQREFGMSDSAVGLLVAIYAIGLLLLALPAGWITARIGARATMVTSLWLFAAASVGFGLANSVLALDIMRWLQGAASALSWTAGFAWLLAVGPKDRQGLLIGSAISAAVAGGIAGPALGALAAQIGRAPVFSGIALAAIALAAAVRSLPEPAESGDLRLMAALRTLRRGPGAISAWVVLLSASLYGSLTVLAPLKLDSLGVGATAIGAIFLGIGVSEIVVGPVVGRISDRLGVRVPMLYALASTAALLVILALVGTLVTTIATIAVLVPSVTAMITPAFTSLGKVAEVYGVASAGVFAAGNLAYASGEGSGALVAGWLEDAGRGNVTYVALAILAVATIAALRSVRHPALGPAAQPTTRA
jgi:predicted MFS family arabinose efflux permease